eukprot:5101083-Pyramimonas_sp.AAC.1
MQKRTALLSQGIADMAKTLFQQAVDQAKSAQAAHQAHKARVAGKRRKREDGLHEAGGGVGGAEAAAAAAPGGEGEPSPTAGCSQQVPVEAPPADI